MNWILVGSLMILGLFMGVMGYLKSEEWLFLVGVVFIGVGFALTNAKFFMDEKKLKIAAIKRIEGEKRFQYPRKRS